MNQGRIWCVVHPTVGLPLFLGSVALTSLAVHASIMNHTTWMNSYWQGSKARTSEVSSQPSVAAVTPKGEPAFVLSIAPVAGTPGKTESSFVVTVAPNPGAATTIAADEATPPASKTVSVAAADLK